jgi:hypothetical protein
MVRASVVLPTCRGPMGGVGGHAVEQFVEVGCYAALDHPCIHGVAFHKCKDKEWRTHQSCASGLERLRLADQTMIRAASPSAARTVVAQASG